jgi:hypothetical protein
VDGQKGSKENFSLILIRVNSNSIQMMEMGGKRRGETGVCNSTDSRVDWPTVRLSQSLIYSSSSRSTPVAQPAAPAHDDYYYYNYQQRCPPPPPATAAADMATLKDDYWPALPLGARHDSLFKEHSYMLTK